MLPVLFGAFNLGGVVGAVIIGALCGFLAGKLMTGSGFGILGNIIVGILGGLIGSTVFGFLGITIGGDLVGAIVTGTIGAVLPLFILSKLKK